MKNNTDTKFGGGQIVHNSQKNDNGLSGVIVVSNTTGMEELEGDDVNVVAGDPNRKELLEKIQQAGETRARIKSGRLNSGKSAKSNTIQPRIASRESNKAEKSEKSNDFMISNNIQDQGLKDEVFNVEEERVFEGVIQQPAQGRLEEYKGEEDNIICYRFPHLNFCACGVDYLELENNPPVQVYREIYLSTLNQSLISKNLLRIGITHILNLSSVEFTKRKHLFKYLTIDVYDNHDEDIKKHFRISNRFICEALESGGKILIHSENSASRAPAFILGFLIGMERVTLKKGLETLKKFWPQTEPNMYFYKQLEQYDLEKLAIASRPN